MFYIMFHVKGRNGVYCEFKIRVQDNRTLQFESVRFKSQFLTLLPSGKPGEPRGESSGPTKHFYAYCKVYRKL